MAGAPLPLGSEERFLHDRFEERRQRQQRHANAAAEELKECTFQPRITAYTDVLHRVSPERANRSVESAGDNEAARAAPAPLPVHARLAQRSAAVELKKQQLREELEAARHVGVTFQPNITRGTVNESRQSSHEAATAAADRLYSDALRLSQARKEALALKEAQVEAELQGGFKPSTNATSSAIVEALGAVSRDFWRAADHQHAAGNTSAVSQSSTSFGRLYDRMKKSEAIASERKKALVADRRQESTFVPVLSPMSLATVAEKRNQLDEDGRRPSKNVGEQLYEEGITRMESARQRAIRDQRTRESEEFLFKPVVTPASAELAARAHAVLLNAATLDASNAARHDTKTRSVPPVVTRQMRLMTAHKMHMEELRRATQEAEEAAIHRRKMAVMRGPSANTSRGAEGHDHDNENTSRGSIPHRDRATNLQRHLEEMEHRAELSRRTKEDLAAQVHEEECPFRPALNPTTEQLVQGRRRGSSADAVRHRSHHVPQQNPNPRSASVASSLPEPRGGLPPMPHLPRQQQLPSTADVSLAAAENASTVSAQARHVLQPGEFRQFIAKQKRHVDKRMQQTQALRRQLEQDAVAECTFRPRTHAAPTETVRAVDGSVRRRARSVDAAPPFASGEVAFLERQRKAQLLARERHHREELVAAGKNPNVPTVDASATLQAPYVAPFSFSDERVDPMTGEIHTRRAAQQVQQRPQQRPRSADGARRPPQSVPQQPRRTSGRPQPAGALSTRRPRVTAAGVVPSRHSQRSK
jgi:hypothetical protein